jgi:hypothetical protein
VYWSILRLMPIRETPKLRSFSRRGLLNFTAALLSALVPARIPMSRLPGSARVSVRILETLGDSSSAGDRLCSLREAIHDANGKAPDPTISHRRFKRCRGELDLPCDHGAVSAGYSRTRQGKAAWDPSGLDAMVPFQRGPPIIQLSSICRTFDENCSCTALEIPTCRSPPQHADSL